MRRWRWRPTAIPGPPPARRRPRHFAWVRPRFWPRCNSPVLSPTLMLSMACTLFGLTPGEALAGMTRNAAKALGLEAEIGTVTQGKAADLCVWRVDRPAAQK